MINPKDGGPFHAVEADNSTNTIPIWHKGSKIKTLLTDKVEEVKNDIGGVIGYTLNLDADETQELFKKLEE